MASKGASVRDIRKSTGVSRKGSKRISQRFDPSKTSNPKTPMPKQGGSRKVSKMPNYSDNPLYQYGTQDGHFGVGGFYRARGAGLSDQEIMDMVNANTTMKIAPSVAQTAAEYNDALAAGQEALSSRGGKFYPGAGQGDGGKGYGLRLNIMPGEVMQQIRQWNPDWKPYRLSAGAAPSQESLNDWYWRSMTPSNSTSPNYSAIPDGLAEEVNLRFNQGDNLDPGYNPNYTASFNWDNANGSRTDQNPYRRNPQYGWDYKPYTWGSSAEPGNRGFGNEAAYKAKYGSDTSPNWTNATFNMGSSPAAQWWKNNSSSWNSMVG